MQTTPDICPLCLGFADSFQVDDGDKKVYWCSGCHKYCISWIAQIGRWPKPELPMITLDPGGGESGQPNGLLKVSNAPDSIRHA